MRKKSTDLAKCRMHEVAEWDAKSIGLGTRTPGFWPCLVTDNGVALG